MLYSSCSPYLSALCMKTQTRTRTSSATTVALSIAIGAAAAFAAVSLNNAFKRPPQSYELPLKGGPVYTRQMCQNDCSQSLDTCNAKTGGSTKCTNQYFSCFAGCDFYPTAESLPGYMAPGYTAPGYVPAGYLPGGYMAPGYQAPGKQPTDFITPGYIPPVNVRQPYWESNDNPPDPKIMNKKQILPVAPSAPAYKK